MLYRACIAALLMALLVPLCPTASADEPTPPPKKPKLEFLYLSAQGVKTDAIAAGVLRSVEAVEGVQSFVWTTPRREAKVVRIVGQADTPTLVAACRRSGVEAAVLPIAQRRFDFQKQLHCNGCVLTVKRALKGVEGMKEIKVAKDKLSVSVVYDAKVAKIAKMREALAGAGYPVKPTP